MAIHPEYADAILSGRKHVEFRKRPLAPDVDTVVIYATAPVKAIIGEFDADSAVVATPADVWSMVGSLGGIEKGTFDEYYAGSDTAAAIRVKRARRYAAPVTLAQIVPEPAVPQSYTYITDEMVTQVRNRAGERQHQLLRTVRAIVRLAGPAMRKPITPGATAPFGSSDDPSEDKATAFG